MTHQNKTILLIIGETGLSTATDLAERNELATLSRKSIAQSLSELNQEGYIVRTLVRIGKASRNQRVFQLSNTGKLYYETETGHPPHVSEAETLTNTHGNLQLGYFFKTLTPHVDVEKDGSLYTIQVRKKTYPLILQVDSNKNELLTMFKQARKINKTVYVITSHVTQLFSLFDILSKNNLHDIDLKTSYLEAVISKNAPVLPPALINAWNLTHRNG